MEGLFMLKVLYTVVVPFWTLILIVWRLFTLLLIIISLPVLFFLPQEIMQNFDEIVNRIALKILWFIWCVIKLCFFIVFALILMLITPVLIIWPPLCVAIWVWAGSIKIF